MTDQEILALPAGPELDGLVDEMVFGIDRRANTNEKIDHAIYCAVPVGASYPTAEHDYVIEVDGIRYPLKWDRNHESPSGDGNWPASWMWGQREGKPWQAVLEKHVAEWRAPARFPYSTDLGSAWRIVEKLTDGGWFFDLATRLNPLRWRCLFILAPDASTPRPCGMADECGTAPLAICRAGVLSVVHQAKHEPCMSVSALLSPDAAAR